MSDKWQVADDAAATTVDNEIVVLVAGQEDWLYYGLKGAAVELWDRLQQSAASEGELVAHLLEIYDVDEATLSADVGRTIADLSIRGMVKKVDA